MSWPGKKGKSEEYIAADFFDSIELIEYELQ
jgi:hypothetical protein